MHHDAVAPLEPVADVDRLAKQNPTAKRLLLGVHFGGLAVVDRAAPAEIEERVLQEFPFPGQAQVELVRVAARVRGNADVRPRREDQFEEVG